jgi:hypothetical protein
MMHDDGRITRREALAQIAVLLGTAISAPTLAGALDASTRTAWMSPLGWVPHTLTPAQLELVAVIADHIIPATDTPGARGAGVHRFVDTLLTGHFPAEERDRFLAGLADLQRRRFVESTREQQIALLTAMDQAAYPALEIDDPRPPETWFFRRMKEMTLVGYYTSQVGASQELRVNPMGVYRGDIPFPASGGREWS